MLITLWKNSNEYLPFREYRFRGCQLQQPDHGIACHSHLQNVIAEFGKPRENGVRLIEETV
jgi:hypothetical protein